MTASATGPSAYSTLQIALHWIIAGLIVMQFLIQDAIELAFDRRADGEAGLPSAWAILHIVIGSMVLVLARVRRHAAAVRRATAAGAAPDLRVQVQAEQFWWRVTYDLPDGPIESANEVHLPAGAVTEFVLTGADIWLLGLSFIEVAAIAAAVELIVGVLKCRAPGMHINLTPLYGWYVLVVGAMILFAFPPLIAGDILFELQRAFDWPFFDPVRGGVIRCSGSTCSGSSATPRSTSSSYPRLPVPVQAAASPSSGQPLQSPDGDRPADGLLFLSACALAATGIYWL